MVHCPKCQSDVFYKSLCKDANGTYQSQVCSVCGYSTIDSDGKKGKTFCYGSRK